MFGNVGKDNLLASNLVIAHRAIAIICNVDAYLGI
jgi:hypothetical protein